MSLTISVAEIIRKSNSELLKKHQSWERVELSFIAEVLNGYAFNSGNFSRQKGTPLIRIRDISRNTTETNYDGPYEEIYLVHPGNLLVGMDGDFNCALWNGPVGILNQRVCKIEVYQEFFSEKFLFYVLPGYLNAINDATSSVTVKHLSSKSVEDILLPLPPLSEQQCIVSAIEQQFTRLDSAVASLRSAQTRIKQYRASLLKSAVEGEMTKQWRAENPIEETGEQLLKRILVERRKRWEEEELAKMREKGSVPKDDKWKNAYKEPQGPHVEDLPALPEGWCWATLEQITTYLRNGLPQKPEVAPPGYRILRINAVRPMRVNLDEVRYLSLSEEEAQDYIIDNGDVLFTRYNGSLDLLGVAGVVKGCTEPTLYPDKLIRVKVILREVSPLYTEIACNVGIARNFIESRARTTAGQKGISGADIKQTPIPLPPLVEQQQIVAEVEARLSNIMKLEEATENNLKRAEHERQSILQEAFAGRLVPQDPQDEPASVLLERIREERKKREGSKKANKVSRKGDRMENAKRRRASKASAGRQEAIGLYEKLVDAGQPLAPDDLFRGAGLKTDEQPESVEVFYAELDVDVAAGLIVSERPAIDKVLLHAVEQDDESMGEDEETEERDGIFAGEMREAREEPLFNMDELPKGEMREAREEPLFNMDELPKGEMRQAREEPLFNVDELPKGRMRKAREEVNTPSLWDE